MIRVLHIMSSIGTPGGVQSLIWNYYEQMDSKEIVFDFIVHNNEMKGFEQRFIEKGSKIYYVPPKRQNIFAHIQGINSVLKETKYDIIHTHQDFLGYISLLLACFNHVKVRIVHSHKANLQENMIKRMQRKILTGFVKVLSTDLFACGKQAAIWTYGKKAFDNGKVYVLNNAVNPQEYLFSKDKRSLTREKLGISDTTFVIGNVARFTYQKNHEFLIQCFEEVVNLERDVLLILAGDGELLEAVKSTVENKKLLDKVLFLGARSDIPDLLQAMDVFVLTSRFEGLPVTMVEAQISDLSCVVSDSITNEIEINRKTTYVCLKEDYSKWASFILGVDRNDRQNRLLETRKCGFDINTESGKLVIYYKKCLMR